MRGGIVYLVGAGPGGAELLTLRAAELIGSAQVIIYDYLASPEILNLAAPEAEKIYVGKKGGDHTLAQDEINSLLAQKAEMGLKVVRLKGGDPYIFGRGAEEALYLHQRGLAFETVPGVSSTAAAAAYAGIPLTFRDYASQAVLATGQESPDKTRSAHHWPSLAKMGTLAMVMGVKNLDNICQNLIEAGKDPQTPAAMIQWGCSPRQRVAEGPLKNLPALVKEMGLSAPALLVIGQVVELRKQLAWYERRPLWGKRILVTRSRAQAGRLAGLLRDLGAEVLERPVIEIQPRPVSEDLARAYSNLSVYNWLVFTSPNGAGIFMGELFKTGRDSRALGGLKIAVIGPGTAEALTAYGLTPDLLPKEYVAEGLLAALSAQITPGDKVLWPRAAQVRPVLAEGLEALGVKVHQIPVYDTVNPVWPEGLLDEKIDLVTFTSASTAEGLAGVVPPERRHLYQGAAIGPIAGQKALDLGFNVAVTAGESSLNGLVKAILKHLTGA